MSSDKMKAYGLLAAMKGSPAPVPAPVSPGSSRGSARAAPPASGIPSSLFGGRSSPPAPSPTNSGRATPTSSSTIVAPGGEGVVSLAAAAGNPPPGELSGTYVASLMQLVAPDAATGGPAVSEAMRHASAAEVKHEIIALGDSVLALNEANWARFRKESESTVPTVVISFLGDTSAGKSHTIRELMGTDDGSSRPFVQPPSVQGAATTFNVNLYVCKSLVPGVCVNMLDFEGENGTETPVMAAARSLYTGGAASSGSHPRHRAVSELFPKLAYTTSDVLVMVCREPFYNRRYLERCVELAKRANSGVHNVDAPALVLVGNKLPGEECELDVRKATAQFFEAWGADGDALHSYFSAIVCVYIPHKRGMWLDASDNLINGAEVFKQQLEQLKKVISVIINSRVQAARSATSARFMTQRQGLWFALLPLVIRELNAGKAVNVSALVDEAWAAAMAMTSQADESDTDIFMSFMSNLRPPRELCDGAPLPNEEFLLRFESFRSLTLAITCRLLAARLRSLEPEVLLVHKVRAYTLKVLRDVMYMLGDVTPCVAAYAGPATPYERPDQPVFCLEEYRRHRAHRTSRRVRGGAGFWGKLTGLLPYTDVWAGDFEAPRLSQLDEGELVATVVDLVQASPSVFMAQLLALQEEHTNPRVSVGYCRLSNLPQFVYGDAPTSRAASLSGSSNSNRAMSSSGSAPSRACLPADAPDRLRLDGRRVPDRKMVYCVGCGFKANPYGGLSGSVGDSSGQSGAAPSVGWVHQKFMDVLTTLGLARPEDGPRRSSVGDAEETEVMEGTLVTRGAAGAGVEADVAPQAVVTSVWPVLSLLLGAVVGEEDGEEEEAGGRVGPAVQHVWLPLCDVCWKYVAPTY